MDRAGVELFMRASRHQIARHLLEFRRLSRELERATTTAPVLPPAAHEQAINCLAASWGRKRQQLLRATQEHEASQMLCERLMAGGFAHCNTLNGANGEVTGDDDRGIKTKAQPKKKPAPKPKKVVTRAPKAPKPFVASTGMAALSHCASKYATAIASPWSPDAQGACIPTFPSKASQKSTAWSRVSAVIGTAGVGFVCVAPCLANDRQCVWYSGSTFTGTAITTVGTGVNNAGINTPWSAVALDQVANAKPTIAGRMVSAGLSCQYTGTVLNLGGQILGLCEPSHYTVEGLNAATMLAYQESECCRTDTKVHWLTTAGIDAQEVQYPDRFPSGTSAMFVYPFSQGYSASVNASLGAPIMGYIFTGEPGSTVFCELVQHMEYIGALASPMATPTHSDARGFEMVNTASNRIPQLRVANPGASTMKLMQHALKEVGHELAPYARYGVRMVGATALTALGGALAGPAGARMGAASGALMLH